MQFDPYWCSHYHIFSKWFSPSARIIIVFDNFLATWYFKMPQDHLHFLPLIWDQQTWDMMFEDHNLGARVTVALELVQNRSLFSSKPAPLLVLSPSQWMTTPFFLLLRPKTLSQLWSSLSFTFPIYSTTKSIDFIFKTHPDSDSFSPLALLPAWSIISHLIYFNSLITVFSVSAYSLHGRKCVLFKNIIQLLALLCSKPFPMTSHFTWSKFQQPYNDL